jgi:hypothetical protein
MWLLRGNGVRRGKEKAFAFAQFIKLSCQDSESYLVILLFATLPRI